MIGLWICPGAWPYTFPEHKKVTSNSIRSLIHIFLFRLCSYLINSFTMLNICLRVLTIERERKTNHRMHEQNFRKQGPRSSVDLPARADPWGLQKYWIWEIYARAFNPALEHKASLHGSPLEREIPRSSVSHVCKKFWMYHFYARVWARTLERKSILHSSPLERGLTCSSGHQGLQKKILGARISRSSGHYPARADFKILENPECVLELQFGFQATILAHNGSNLNIIISTWY